MKRWTLRTKLTAWSALMVGIALVICGAGAILFIHEEQIEALDDQLKNEAHTFFGAIDLDGATLDWTQRADVKAILPLTRTERFVEIVGADGQSLYRSKEPKRADLPRLGAGAHTIRIGKDDARLGIFPSSGRTPASKGMTLYLATELNEIDADSTELVIGLLLGLPLIVATIALGGWWLARKALAPVSDIATAAEQITAENLDLRLSAPPVHDEIGRLTDVLNAMLDRLSSSFRQAVRFSADASHELKTPLTVLRSSIEDLMESPTLASEDRASVSALLEQTHRLTGITESLLLLSRADTGRLQLDFRPSDVAEIVTACADDAHIMAESRDITIEKDVPAELIATVDPRRLGQILLNLLDNAVKYNRTGGVIRINAAMAGDQLTFTVANTGPGIPPENIPHLFERFFRSNVNPDTPGQGLGLSLARELARAHGGDLELVQSDAEWTKFLLRIPNTGLANPQTPRSAKRETAAV